MAHFSGKLCPSFRPSRNLSLILLILLLSAFSLRLHSQTLPPSTSDDQMGDQAYQSYHGGDIDSVSLTSGTLALKFPFLSYPQRGKLNLSFNLMYNNQPQHQGQFCNPPPLPPKCVWFWGWPPAISGSELPLERGDVYVGWAQQLALVGQYITATADQDTIFYSNWSLQMADGSKHPLANMGTFTWYTNASWCGANGVHGTTQCSVANGPLETLDATGWRVNGSINPCLNSSGLGCAGALYQNQNTSLDANGVIYASGMEQDPNGNEITSTSTGLLDSLGRQIPLPPTASSSGNTSTSICPVTTGQPAATKAVLWSPPLYNNGTQQYVFCYASFYQSIVGIKCNSSITLLQSIVLPNGQSWQFQYNDPDPNTSCAGYPVNYTTLFQVTLPTGGTIQYTYAYGGAYLNPSLQTYGRWVASRTLNANDGTGAHTWNYAYTLYGGVPTSTVVTDPLGNDVMHTFGAGGGGVVYETQTQYYQGSHTSGTLLKTVNTTYSYSTASLNTFPNGPINTVPTAIQTVWPDGQTNQTTKAYDSGYSYTDYSGNTKDRNGNPNVGIYGKEIKEQAWDYPSGSSLLRTTNTSYAWQSNSNYLTNNFLNLVSSAQVLDSGGTQRAYTTYGYDESSLQSSGITGQKVTGESYPGNQTSVHRWLNGSTTGTTNCSAVTNGYLVTTKVYYDTGEVPTVTDPCGYQTNYQYSATYYGAFVTEVTNALGQNMSYGYDFNTGAVTSITDWNSQITNKNYDMLTRLLSASYPDGGSTTLCYSDTPTSLGGTCPSGPPFQVIVTKAITSSLNETSAVVVDGLGRTSQTQLTSDPSGTTYTQIIYDALGRKSEVYNPTRCSPPTTNCGTETTWGYATTNYDALSRVTSVVEQDGSTVSTNYSAVPCTTVTDEAGNSRQSCADGLGRMTSVLEDPGSSPHLNYPTTYQYDVLGDLTNVTQNGSNGAYARVRTFAYDSLAHLTSATNPESGTITYAYDADSNVVAKTAPLPNQTLTATVTTTNSYDKLNRLTSESYKDGNNPDPYTPTVQFGYDAVALTGCTTAPPGLTDTYPVGRRTAMCDGSGAASWAHDKMGRVLTERRTIGAVLGDYETDAYNLNGSPITVTTLGYGVSYTYSRAARLLTATNNTGGVTKFVSGATYAPPGELAGATLGSATGFAGFTVNNTYNDRLQPILLSASSPSATVFSDSFDFHLGAGDNGNVFKIVNNRDSTHGRDQNFIYDSLNRIQQAYSTGSGTYSWGETFSPTATSPGVAPTTPGIDAWGNLTNRSGVTGKTYAESLNCPANTNNQLTACSDAYDAAGNMTGYGTASYVYDAENRLIATAGYSYIYDADGQRVEKCTEGATPGTCATGATGTLYWRGLGSDPLSETDLAGNVQNTYIFFGGQRVARRDSAGAIHYYFSDHLGSHGVVENATGTTCEQDIDYYPYGGVENDYCAAVSQNYKFTGKERDSESGLDEFGARYYGSSLGRFMTPDWAAKPTAVPYAHYGNPQSLNLYSYVQNNPTTTGDPDGHCDWCWTLVNRVAEYVATHPEVANAVQKLGDSMGLKVSLNLGDKGKIGPVKLALAAGVTAELREDGSGKSKLQATAGASVNGVGFQANGTGTFAEPGSFVNPLKNLDGNAKLTGSGSHGDDINSNLAVGTDGRVAVGPAVDLGVGSGGVQVTAGTQEVTDVARSVGNAAINDTEQIIHDARVTQTCTIGGCSVSPH
jgi:RHS repeat-associated protein